MAAVPPLTFAWSRLAVALCILAPLEAFSGRASRLSVADVARMMGAGVLLLGVNDGLVYWGAQFVPSGLVAILQSGTLAGGILVLMAVAGTFARPRAGGRSDPAPGPDA